MSEKGICFGGSLIVDQVKMIHAYPDPGNLAVIESVHRGTGGMAANNAVNLRVLDASLPVGVVGRVGDDGNGGFVLEQLAACGANVDMIRRVPGATSFTDVMTLTSTGARTFFHAYGVCADLSPADFDCDAIADAYACAQVGYALLLATLDAADGEFGTKLGRVLAGLRSRGVRTAIDVVSEQSDRFATVVRPALPHVDDLILNEVEAGGVTGLSARDGSGRLQWAALRRMVGALFGYGVRRTVVIHAPEGCVGAAAGGEVLRQPSHAIPDEQIVGTTGAGDAFCSGVLYGLFRERPLAEALKLGTAMAGLNLFDPTCTGAARPLAAVEAFMKDTPYRAAQ